MKKNLLTMIVLLTTSIVFAQSTVRRTAPQKEETKVVAVESFEREFKNIIRVNPLATIQALLNGGFEIDIQYSEYFTPKVAMPVEVSIFGAGDRIGFAVLTGIEAVPIPDRQKSGLFLNALAGPVVSGSTGIIINPNIGYQFIKENGFVFNATAGLMYNTITDGAVARLMVSLGYAF